jgi:altronate hydrolase
MKDNIIIIHPKDNVAVALRELAVGERAVVNGADLFIVLEKIPASHKVALLDIPSGGEIFKYGETVAVTIRDIRKGEWVHTHNLKSQRWKK